MTSMHAWTLHDKTFLAEFAIPLIQDLYPDFNVPESNTEFSKDCFDHAILDFLHQRFHHIIGDIGFKDILLDLHTLGRWFKFGMPIFRITEDLLASLLLTDPSNVDPEEVKAPFPTFLLEIPDNYWVMDTYTRDFSTFDAIQTTPKAIRNIWIHNCRTVYGSENNIPEGQKIPFQQLGQLKHSPMLIITMEAGGTRLFDRICPPGTMPHGQEQGQCKMMTTWLTQGSRETPGPFPMERTDQDMRYQAAARRLYINLSLYVAEQGRGTKVEQYTTKAKKRRMKRKNKKSKAAKELPKPNVWIIGKEITLCKEMKDAAKAWTEAQSGSKAAWKIKKRFTVRGHWRNQACGPSRQERKRIWVQPFWKGPKEGEKLTHVYTDEKKTKTT